MEFEVTEILTKEEIQSAIENYIGLFKKQVYFFPYKVVESEDFDIPETVMFRLKLMEKEVRKCQDCQKKNGKKRELMPNLDLNQWFKELGNS